jgi:hypothetical protein
MKAYNEFMQASPFGMIAPEVLALLIFLSIIALILKAFALWYAARAGQKAWFVALVIINTFGIFELIYLTWFRPQSFELEERLDEKSSGDA